MANPVRKKILIVRPTLGEGGADRVTINILQALDTKKYEVILFLMRLEGSLLKEVPSNVTVLSENSRNLITFILPLTKLVRVIKPDILFAPCGGSSISLAIAHFLTRSKSKLVLSERGRLLRSSKAINRILRLPLKWLFFRRAHDIIVVSKAVQNDMERLLFIPSSKIKLLDNPVVAQNYIELSNEAVSHLWINSGTKIIMHAGRFVPEKDHETLIKAFEILQKKIDVKLMLFGDGSLKAKVEKLVETLQLNGKVQFMGFQPNLYSYLKHASVFVLSSISEGMPGVLIQAMALGIPCVSTDCPTGPGEIIRSDLQNGILVPMKNSQALAEALNTLLTSKSQYEIVCKNSAKSVSRFLADKSIGNYIQILVG